MTPHDPYLTRRWRSDEPVDRERFEAALRALPRGVVRAKGVVRFADDPWTRMEVHLAAQRLAIVPAGEWITGPSRVVATGIREELASSWTLELG